MILCDIGNTTYHFLDEKSSYKKYIKDFNPANFKEKVFYISVNKNVEKELENLINWINIESFIDRTNYYKTMGIDRIVACEAINDGIIIDAGSAITVDVMSNGFYMGGFIYPGVRSMGETYKKISVALDYDFNFDIQLNQLPKNSKDSITYGFLKGLYTEVYSYNKKIYLTGGDADLFSHIFIDAIIDKDMIFRAMKKFISIHLKSEC